MVDTKFKKWIVYEGKDKPRSEETRQKISDSKRGKRTSIKTEFKKGHTFNAETIEKMSLIRKENPTNFWKGKKRSEETKEKIRQKLKGRKLSPETIVKWKGRIPWNYIDGRSKEKCPARYCDVNEWKKIRKLVYMRDHFTCQKCGKKKIELDVHHKIPFLISLDNSLNNLISLCRSCHTKEDMKFHKIYNKLIKESNKNLSPYP